MKKNEELSQSPPNPHVTPREKQQRARRRLVFEHPFALRLAALSVICRYFYVVMTLIFTGLALTVLREELRTALILLAGLPIVWLWSAISTTGLCCLVCRGPALKSRGCVKHRTAKALFGSYPLGMAFRVIFAKRFRCMHCGTQQRLVDDGE